MLKLSAFHRYGIAIVALIIIAVLFWPADDTPLNSGNNQSQPITIPAPTLPESVPEPILTPQPEQPSLNEPSVSLPSEPDIISEPIESLTPEPPPVTPAQPDTPKTVKPSANEWKSYRVQKGKTLAQLFRDNNLQANDAFAMARAEGSEKPLSNIQQGQKIRLKANEKGEVQLLEITSPDGKTYSFARLSDGGYYRTP